MSECEHYWTPLDDDPDPKGAVVDVRCQLCKERRRMTIEEYFDIPAGLPPDQLKQGG